MMVQDFKDKAVIAKDAVDGHLAKIQKLAATIAAKKQAVSGPLRGCVLRDIYGRWTRVLQI